MTSAPTVESLWHPRLLAALLRNSRVTLLFGAAGAGKSALLQTGLMPLLRRRAADRALIGQPPFGRPEFGGPERRTGDAVPELVIRVDHWGSHPLEAWVEQLRRALPPGALPHVGPDGLARAIGNAAATLGARFLFVFDAFERSFEAGDAATIEFTDALVEVISDAALPAHVLLAVRDGAESKLEALRARIPGFGDYFVRVPAPRDTLPLPPQRSAQMRMKVGPPAANRGDHAEAPLTPQSPTAPTRRARPVPWLVTAAVLVPIVAGVLLAVDAPAGRDEPRVPTPASARPEAVQSPPVASPQPATTIQLGFASDAEQISNDLARALPRGGVAVQRQVAESVLAPGGSVPWPYAVVRHDALLALRAGGGAAALRVITPLMLDEVHAVVRADSPWRHLHEMAGRRIDLGPAGSAREATALALYRRLAGREPLPAQREHRSDADALDALLAGRGAQVVLLVGAQPLAALGRLAPAQQERLRLLALDRRHASTARALQAFVPSAIGITPTLAAMAWLVGTADNDGTDALLARALCRALPALRETGHPRWRDVRLGADLPAPVPTSAAAADEWTRCPTPNPGEAR